MFLVTLIIPCPVYFLMTVSHYQVRLLRPLKRWVSHIYIALGTINLSHTQCIGVRGPKTTVHKLYILNVLFAVGYEFYFATL